MNENIKLLKNTSFSQNDILYLLSHLTTCHPIHNDVWNHIINNMYDNQHIFCYILDDKLVGMITVIIEQKLIHSCKCIGHIEDLVVDPLYRNKHIARQLLDHVYNFCKNKNCYKIILNCTKELEPFYKRNHFYEHSIQMRRNI